MSDYETKKLFSENLTRLLRASGKTQSDFAKDIKVSESTVSSWCNGEKMPRMDKIEWMASYFNVPITSLIEQGGALSTRRDDIIKAAFWGGEKELDEKDIDELWEDARAYIAFKTQQRKQRKKTQN